MSALAQVPQCPEHGSMRLRPGYSDAVRGNGHTAEQRWCGVWYDCVAEGPLGSFRHRSALTPSPALLAQEKEMRKEIDR